MAAKLKLCAIAFIAILISGAFQSGMKHYPGSGDKTMVWPWVVPFLKTLGSGIAAGAVSGATRRTERAVAGSAAARDVAGGQTPQTVLYGTQQAASQGQSEAFQASQADKSQASYSSQAMKLQGQQLAHQSGQNALQRAHERSLLSMELSSEGQSASGEIPWWKVPFTDAPRPSRSPNRPAKPDYRSENLERSLNTITDSYGF